MIDDKKIEEATRNYINKNGYFIKYNEEPCVDIEFAYREGYKEGCKDAINEFLKDLLHPAEEIPEEERPVLVVYKHGGYSIEYWKAYNISGQVNYWTLDITQWLYVDDLFPKKGDKQ